jgi:predicted enzyme related to lactoylglutathione lyase
VPAQENRIVMINIAVNELDQSRRFYEEVLDVEFAEERHGDGAVHLNATFGEWNTQSWFLMSLWPNPDRAGTVDIGFLVKDVDQAYERALSMGAGDVSGPREIEGMPRNAEVTDPSGNHIGLYQG